MTEHDEWAHDYIQDEAPVQIASAMVALADEVRLLMSSARDIEEMRQAERSEPAKRLGALVNATGTVEWQASQVMYTLATRVSDLKTPR